MKKTIYLIFIIYFIVFIVGGYFIYNRYLANPYLLNNNALSTETVSTVSKLYFISKNTLYRINTDYDNPPKDISENKIVVTEGDIGHLEIDNNQYKAYFELKNSSGNWEIWDSVLGTFQQEIYINASDNNFADYSDFQVPKISPDGDYLAFIGRSNNKDAIFIKNLSDNSTKSIVPKENMKIVDFSWNKNSDKIVYCSSNLAINTCAISPVFVPNSTASFTANIKNISFKYTDKIIYLSNSPTPHLFIINEDGSANSQIDDITEPKKIANFSISNDGQNIIYEVIGEQKSDIYYSNIDGSNRAQLTTDGQSTQPIFSNNGEFIAYIRQNEGIFTQQIANLKEDKILNLNDSLDSLITWR